MFKIPQMNGYAKKLNKNVTMSFKANNKQLLKITKKYRKKLRS